jgi:Asp-tRNA(Asn)/Glu-tRNA(Gln) amidotransferase A subunit family amidase
MNPGEPETRPGIPPVTEGGRVLTALSAVRLRELIGTGEISPVELLDACIDRIQRLNPAVNAVTATCFARARREATAAEAAVRNGEPLGPLHGLPLGVKDLENTAGLLTTRGSPLLRDNVPDADGAAVARLRAAGAIVIGKTNVPEWGAGANSRNPVWGATGNAFDPMRNAGGSSGGSAVALACDMVPLATGSDTGGSLRIPAALAGVVGVRPSPGVVPAERRELGWSPLSVVGPMGRTVADARLQLSVMAGPDDVDPLSYPLPADAFHTGRPVDPGRLRIAYTADFGVCPVDPDIRAVFAERVSRIAALVGRCDPIDLSADMASADRCFDVLRALSFVTGFADVYRRDPDLLGPNVRDNYEIGAGLSLADVGWAHREQTRIFRRFNELFADYDLVLAPVTPVSPFPWTTLYPAAVDGVPARNYYHWLGLTYLVTLTTNPALSLPCGMDRHGLPFGLQVIAGHRQDAFLLDAAESLEAVFRGDPVLRRPIPDVRRLIDPVPALRDLVTAAPPPALVRDDSVPPPVDREPAPS